MMGRFLFAFFMKRLFIAAGAIFFDLHFVGMGLFVACGDVIVLTAFAAF